MKKYLAVLLAVALFSPALFAEDLSFDVKEVAQEYSEIFKDFQVGNHLLVFPHTEYGEYFTEQQVAPEDPEFVPNLPGLERHRTENYKEILISVPRGYIVDKHIALDTTVNEPYLPFLSERSILMYTSDNSHNDKNDISFKLDYDITLSKKVSYEANGYVTKGQPMALRIRFSSKYFTWKSVSKNYNPFIVSRVKYGRKTITLKAKVYEVLRIITPSGRVIRYVLEPNFQNIYNDFEFVRNSFK